MSKLLSVSEVAERLGVGNSRVTALINEGRLPFVRGEGRGRPYFVPESAVENFQRYDNGRNPDILVDWNGFMLPIQVKAFRTPHMDDPTLTSADAVNAIKEALEKAGFIVADNPAPVRPRLASQFEGPYRDRKPKE